MNILGKSVTAGLSLVLLASLLTFGFNRTFNFAAKSTKSKIFTEDTYVKLPRPSNCVSVISEKYDKGILTLTYETENGDVALSKWKIIFEGTALLSASKVNKPDKKNVPVPEITTNVSIDPDAVIKEVIKKKKLIDNGEFSIGGKE